MAVHIRFEFVFAWGSDCVCATVIFCCWIMADTVGGCYAWEDVQILMFNNSGVKCHPWLLPESTITGLPIG